MNLNLDVHTGIITAFGLAVIGVAVGLFVGIRSIQSGSRLMFFRKRREIIMRGWRAIFIALILAGISFFLFRYAEPAVYSVFPPSPTVTNTPTITLTPTITQTPTITLTPTITNTPSITSTPQIPSSIQNKFTSKITPNPLSVFSPMQFAREIDKNNQPINPATEFKNPIPKLYGTFSYDKMLANSQFTALWLRVVDGTVICYETRPWDGSTGGYGSTECAPSSDAWKPGLYEVQIYVGTVWNVSSRFTVTGQPPTPTITISPSRTPLPSATIAPSVTLTFTLAPNITPSATGTPTALPTGTVTNTLPPTSTMVPTLTPRITDTRWPSQTPGTPTP